MLILQQLKGMQGDKFDIEVHNRFPTLHQLKYMNDIDAQTLQRQIPKLSELLRKETSDSVFGSDLARCVQVGLWNPQSSLWVDWEKKHMGDNVESITNLLKNN